MTGCVRTGRSSPPHQEPTVGIDGGAPGPSSTSPAPAHRAVSTVRDASSSAPFQALGRGAGPAHPSSPGSDGVGSVVAGEVDARSRVPDGVVGPVGGVYGPCALCRSRVAPPKCRRHDAAVIRQDHGISTPSPDREAIRRAVAKSPPPKTSLGTAVTFCIDTDGTVSDVRTEPVACMSHLGAVSGSSEVDELFRATVELWRFRPVVIDGKPRRVCTGIHFVLELE